MKRVLSIHTINTPNNNFVGMYQPRHHTWTFVLELYNPHPKISFIICCHKFSEPSHDTPSCRRGLRWVTVDVVVLWTEDVDGDSDRRIVEIGADNNLRLDACVLGILVHVCHISSLLAAGVSPGPIEDAGTAISLPGVRGFSESDELKESQPSSPPSEPLSERTSCSFAIVQAEDGWPLSTVDILSRPPWRSSCKRRSGLMHAGSISLCEKLPDAWSVLGELEDSDRFLPLVRLVVGLLLGLVDDDPWRDFFFSSDVEKLGHVVCSPLA